MLLLGATGTFGKELTKKLVQNQNYQLTLVARHTNGLSIDSPNTQIIQGDATDPKQLQLMVANQDVIYLAISGNQLPKIAENLVTTMNKEEIDRLIFMGAIGIYNEIPDDIGGKDNVDNNPSQVPNMEVVNIIEQSNLNYTILRPGYLRDGEVDDFVLTKKGQLAKGLITTISSLVSIAEDMMNDDSLYSRESISITKEATK